MIRFLAFRAAFASLALAQSSPSASPALAQSSPSGATLFAPCKVCHSLDPIRTNGLGPPLNGVVGRKAGTVVGFTYSAAMKTYGKVWTPMLLDAYLTNPRKTIPGNRMSYPGLKDPGKRVALITWLKSQ